MAMRITLVSLLSFIFCYCTSLSNIASGQCLEDQKTLLRLLKSNLKFKSESSSKLKLWNQNIACCNWKGVTCDIEGHVIGLDLSGELISGGFDNSSSLFGLQHLQKLNLAYNNFNSPIPSRFNKLDKLTYLNLSDAGFVGQIPIEISQLTSLVTLDISSLGCLTSQELKLEDPNLQKLVQNLTSIKQLVLDRVIITAQRHEWCNALLPLRDLQELSMSNCNLSGPLGFLRNKSMLTTLDLSHNQIQGKVPNWIWKLKSLQNLNISQNLLTGFEGPLQNLTSNLISLDFHNNHLQGPIPVIPIFAGYLDYSTNNFSVIPQDIGNYLSSAYFLSLSNNNLHGSIPDSLCNATNLVVLDVSMNSISGTIPSCLINMTKYLGVLNLRMNSLTGPIPDMFPASCALRTLDLQENKLYGQIPKSLAKCSELEVLDLGNNQIIDGFPCFLKNVSTLRVLVLRKNKFCGPIGCPKNKHTWHMLQIVDIAFNNFSGKLPGKSFPRWEAMMFDEDQSDSKVNHIQFQVLQFDGGIYYQDSVKITSKGQQMELVKIITLFTSIDFSSNHFHGEIPKELFHFKALYVLNLSNNALSGQIPSSIGNLKQLESLDLSNNSLEGKIPTEIASLSFLTFLNLSFNQLSGKIPTGPQIQSFEDTSFIGNKGLCGPPLTPNCGMKAEMRECRRLACSVEWNFISAELGFVFSIGILIGSLLFWKEGRVWYWKLVHKTLCWIFPQLYLQHVNHRGQSYEVLRWQY